uniref:Uncharacterized protein n=1 Tax=Candidatus Kentrum sp. TUN TaxID=2126343 RepID=A0A450ZXI7_9GAMM|nr:MAG: hypothetical protein BECKTUN1418D_GA0071000_10834 [Candidatus Kentron sp. TUN]
MRFFAPRGYVYQPRVAAQQLPWVGKGYATNPERVASLFSQVPFTQPRWGWIFVRSLPRVAAARQPWADIRSPLGAKKRTAESTRYAKTGRAKNNVREIEFEIYS